MENKQKDLFCNYGIILLAGLLLVSFTPLAYAVTLNVVDENGAPVGNYRWLLEEDTTHPSVPGNIVTSTAEAEQSLSFSSHKSYAPVAAKGSQADAVVIPDPGKKYFISVLPDGGYTIGGAPVAAGATGEIKVVVNSHPVPTAQISVLVFEDNNPINNSPQLPGEIGLEGFDILVEDAGGRYGMSAGHAIQDAFGNPLGTSYKPDGSVNVLGTGVLKTDADGRVLIRNLAPGKYGIQAVPPAGEDWHQTTTLEGKKVIDAWVKAGEPAYFREFGPPGHHIIMGFVKRFIDNTVLSGSHGISGRIVNLHNTRPPEMTFHAGHPIPNCWIGLNDLSVGVGKGIYAQPCNEDSTFSIANVPPGDYQLVIWDAYLDLIFGILGVTVESDGSCAIAGGATSPDCSLGDVPVFAWFGRMEHHVFFDADEDGFRDPGELGMLEQAVNLRWRDGTMYQSFPTDLTGFVPFDEIFPFFHWLVAEVDFARFKSTGATITVDGGGPVAPGEMLTPQPQKDINPNTGDKLSRTIEGEVLTQAFQSFLGTTSVIEWGKANYGPGENGGITGIVYYATTRAEDDPQLAAAEVWEPGIPRVQVNLYQDSNEDGIVDDLNNDGCPTPSDVDNYPFDSVATPFPGPEDIKYAFNLATPDPCDFINSGAGTFDAGDAVQITTTDSWDDNMPTGCVGTPGIQSPFFVHGDPTILAQDCFEGLRTYNQIRDGVFDGGYALNSYVPGGITSGNPEVSPLIDGTYIVEATLPPNYNHLKSQDRNVDFGDEYIPAAGLAGAPALGAIVAIPPCVGEPYTVPDELSLFPGVEAPMKGQELPLCNRKPVTVKSGMTGGGFNAVSDFFLYTEVPIAARVVGFVLDDLANEFDPKAPNFGEKYAPPWIPVSFHDYKGYEISRVYTDQYGKYNALVPSTYTANIPMPSGMSPNMLTTCINSPGPIEDPDNPGNFIIDPYFQRQYTQFCYTFQFMPGTTTYLDTPVLPVAGFAGSTNAPLDCEFPNTTPMIYSVSAPGSGGGPYVSATGQSLTITSAGLVDVLNPAYDGTNNKIIQRDYGFGIFSPGFSKITLAGVELTNVVWLDGIITGDVPAGLSQGAHQLSVTRGDSGKSTVTSVTVTVGGPAPVRVLPGGSIQDAIDVAADGDLILVPPGVYNELVIMWKDVKLQGWGAASTIINAVKAPSEKLQLWRQKMDLVIGDPLSSPYLLPGQEGGFDLMGNEPLLFGTEEGPGVIVLGRNNKSSTGRVDGFSVTGGDQGGGVFINGYTNGFHVSNNRVFGNQGFAGGGVRAGHLFIIDPAVQTDAQNDNLRIHNNQIIENGSLFGTGGGIALYAGTEGYEIVENFVCGNFSSGNGAGIGHLGMSDGGLIARNTIIFNQSFNQGLSVSGGGVFIGGIKPAGNQIVSIGSGSVVVDSNLILGNLAGAGDGGGIRTEFVNGEDVVSAPGDPAAWYGIDLINNMIVNNVTGLAGGGISMQDTANIRIVNNTIAHNDSTATASEAFSSGPSISIPQPAGIVSRAHSPGLSGAIGAVTGRFLEDFSSPMLLNNIIWRNRSFYWDISLNGGVGGQIPDPSTPVYNDLAVLGTLIPEKMDPMTCLLTDATGYDTSNIDATDGEPDFITGYFNGSRGHLVFPEVGTVIDTMPAFDEGGNFIDVRFGPLTLIGNYHIQASSVAKDAGAASLPEAGIDFDRERRPDPFINIVDIGADEYYDPSGANPSPDVVGPVVSGISVVPDPTNGASSVSVTATVSDVNTGNSNVNRAEWWVGAGPAVAMSAQDGILYSPSEIVTANVPIPGGTPDGDFVINIRGRDNKGNWGPVSVYVVTVNQPPVSDVTGPITYNMSASPNPTNGDSSVTLSAIGSDTTTGVSNIIAAEWWMGIDPGVGLATPMVALDGAFDSPAEALFTSIPISIGTPEGDYLIYIRSKDSSLNWGAVNSVLLTVNFPATRGKPSTTGIIYQCPTDTDGDGISDDPEVVCVHLVAGDGFVKMADGYLQYIFGFSEVTNVPGVNPYDALHVMNEGMLAANLTSPTIVIKEGQKLFLTVTNVGMQIRPDLFDSHTVHWHGFPNASAIFDGVPNVSVSVNQLSSFTYFYAAAKEGTYLYHCHVEATEHMQMGMYGNLWVTPSQDGTILEYPAGSEKYYSKFAYNDGDGSTGYDMAFPVMVSSSDPDFHDASMNVQPLPFANMDDKYGMINGRGYPDTKTLGDLIPPVENGNRPSQRVSTYISATKGETILLRLTNLSVTRSFTITVLGIPMKVVGKDTGELKSSSGEKLHYFTNSVNVAGGDTYDVLLYTKDVPPGTYFLYTTNLNFLSNNTEDFGGIMTEIKINP